MPRAGIMSARNTKRRNSVRRDGGLRNVARPTPVAITSAVAAGTSVTLTFNQFVSLKGIPQFKNQAGTLPTSASMTNPTTLVLNYPALSPVATEIVIPADDPAIRSSSGGFVTPSTFEV